MLGSSDTMLSEPHNVDPGSPLPIQSIASRRRKDRCVDQPKCNTKLIVTTTSVEEIVRNCRRYIVPYSILVVVLNKPATREIPCHG